MKTETVDLNDAQAHLKELVHRAVAGVHVVLSENDKPVAQIVPLKRRAGSRAGQAGANEGPDALPALTSLIGSTRGQFASPEEADAYLRRERDAWES
ncbi:MAG TPA: type II toxin-antitoxin system prevent-host-death family antitoxin [Planctomycetota bacterium]|nr:type II toxin-antitoxin system prevent-host-death family antitoxin [Planctomycetota bacterium]HRR82087.1 type II toxin-antitoxin system prevent-host-death family antitoxin [Planctomycetota bacterium]HRT96450.1 type II toxin-antitoxin system prevent-host-death family antitoxin [Planctomycetota bacterium]